MSLNTNLLIYNKKNIWDLNGLWLPVGKFIFILNKQEENTSTGMLISDNVSVELTFMTEDLMKMVSNAFKEFYMFDKEIINKISSYNEKNDFYSDTDTDIENLQEEQEQEEENTENNNLFYNEQIIADQCPICLMDINEEDKEILICSHKFHKNCILRWVHENNSCPVCRHRIIQEDNNSLPPSPPTTLPSTLSLPPVENIVLTNRRNEYNRLYSSSNIERLLFHQ